jgi:endonuclease YncB( thermonuclease family)
MKNNYTYINTTKEFQTITVQLKDGTVQDFTISPGSVFSENMIIKSGRPVSNAEISNIQVAKKVSTAGGGERVVTTMLNNNEVVGVQDLLKKSIILDIETTGKLGADAITQIGLYNVGKDSGKLFIPQANLIVRPNRGEMALRTRKKPIIAWAQLVDLPSGITQAELKRAETMFDMIKNQAGSRLLGGVPAIGPDATDKEIYEAIFREKQLLENPENIKAIDQYMIETDKFQAKQFVDMGTLKKAGVSIDQEDRAFQELIHSGRLTQKEVGDYLKAKSGRSIAELFTGGFELVNNRSLSNIMTQDMPDLIKGNITWIANATFEAKQFGAQIDARMSEAFDVLNEVRVKAGQEPLNQKAYIKEFTMGMFEEEISQLNRGRPADKQLLTKNPFYGVVGSVSVTSGEPFYVTGADYNIARATAAKTGDYSPVYDVIRNQTQVGDVRDILDLVRAQQSSLIKLGSIANATRPSNVGIEIQARLLGFTEELSEGNIEAAKLRLFEKETHQAIGDVRLSETPVLRESLSINEALYQLRNKTAEGHSLLVQARQSKGKLFSAFVYGELFNYVNQPFTDKSGNAVDTLHDVIFRQRAGRQLLDIAEQGFTTISSRKDAYRVIEQAAELPGGAGGIVSKITVPNVNLTRVSTYQGLKDSLLALEDYPGADKDKILKEIETEFGQYFDEKGLVRQDRNADFRIKASSYSESAAKSIEALEMRFKDFDFQKILGAAKQKALNLNLSDISLPKYSARSFSMPKMPVKAIAAAGLVMAAFSAGEPERASSSLTIPNYEQFLEAQSQFYGGSVDSYLQDIKAKYGNIEGMGENGIAADIRKLFTDFGSPYQSPYYSQSVLEDFRLRKERNAYVQSQFNRRHFSEEGDVGFFFKRFIDSAFRKQYGYSPQSPSVISGAYQQADLTKYNSLRGENLVEYTFDNGFDITVEDADTITIKGKGNLDNPLSNFMGSDGTYRFRFAGIDAPETAHDGRRAQPYAEEAKRIAQDMILSAKEVKVVTEPGDSTYGRQVGLVYADGQLVNLELIKRGAAAYLPYKGKGKPAIYDQQAFEAAQQNAQKSQRGMWREGFFQAYKAITDASGQSVTFNTLVNINKVAENSSLMSMYSLMNQAQDMGMVTNAALQGLTELGEDIKSKGDQAFKDDSFRNNGWMQTDLEAYGRNPNSINSILEQLKSETGAMMKTRGSKNFTQKLSVKALSGNNMMLADNTLSHRENPVEQRPRISNEDRYKRSINMANMQQSALANMFNSPIGHYRM